MKLTILAIEDAILAALAPLKASLKVREIKPYAGEIEPEKIKTLGAWPFLLVSHSGVPGLEDHGQRKVEPSRWLVLVGDRHTDLALARRGSLTNPGTYTLQEAARQMLEGKKLLPGLLPATRLGEETLVNEAGMSVYACHYEISQPYLA